MRRSTTRTNAGAGARAWTSVIPCGALLVALMLHAAPAAAQRPAPPHAPGGPTPGDMLRDCADCPTIVVVPPGRFRMGAEGGEKGRYEGPVHEVRIARAFGVGRYEVTIAEYRRFVEASGHPTTPGCATWDGENAGHGPTLSWRDPGFGRTLADDEPVVCISWNDASAYTAWLSQRTGQRYRLLSEAEWEYVARPSAALDTPWGKDEAQSCRYANVLDQSGDPERKAPVPVAPCNDGFPTSSPVGRFPPNRFGLHDVIGNVWEWVQDCYVMTYLPSQTDAAPQLAHGCDRRSVRGGSWRTRPDRQRVTFRGRDPADTQSQVFGFRLARDL